MIEKGMHTFRNTKLTLDQKCKHKTTTHIKENIKTLVWAKESNPGPLGPQSDALPHL